MKLKEKHITIIAIVTSLFIAFIFFGQNLKAQMGIIDDHVYIERGVVRKLTQALNNFSHAPEIRQFGQSGRFRIIYLLINDVEASFFGMNAQYFYIINICVFAFFIFTIFYVVWKNMDVKWAILFTLFILIPSYFAYIFTRLGTAEVWTVFGLSVYALGFSSVYQKSKENDKQHKWKEWVAMFCGIIIMIGSKENFAIIGTAVIGLLIILGYRKKIGKIDILFSLSILLLNFYQIAYIVTVQARQKVDFYQNDSGILYRASILVKNLFEGYELFFIVSVIFFFVVLFCMYVILFKKKVVDLNKFNSTKQKEIFENMIFIPSIFLIILSLFFLFNVYIYNGNILLNHRYAFPLMLIIQILILILLRWIFYTKEIFFSQFKIKFGKVIHLVLIMVLFFLIFNNAQRMWLLSQKNVQATQMFQEKLQIIIDEVQFDQDTPIIFMSYAPFDWEALRSVLAYLRYYNINNEIMVKTQYEVRYENPLTQRVAQENIDLEKKGNSDFKKLNENIYKCFLIDFSGKTTDTKCKNIGKIWQLGQYPY